MTRQRPLIGVTGPDAGHGVSWFFIWLGLQLAGAHMVRFTPKTPKYECKIDGLICSGGTDIDPLRYGKERKPNYFYNMPREDMERQWLAYAADHKLPILGICRGAQLLNVVHGGSLFLDIRLVCETAKYPGGAISKIFYRKPAIVKQGSLLESIMQEQLIQVNSLHRQSLDSIGAGLTVTSWEENKIVQAIEGEPTDSFKLGVQWHPEFMPFSAQQRRVFKAFVKQAKAHADT